MAQTDLYMRCNIKLSQHLLIRVEDMVAQMMNCSSSARFTLTPAKAIVRDSSHDDLIYSWSIEISFEVGATVVMPLVEVSC